MEANKGRSEGEHPLADLLAGGVSGRDPMRNSLLSNGAVIHIRDELNRLHAIEHDPMRKAAPELYEVLDALLAAVDCDEGGVRDITKAFDNARAALSKARGEAVSDGK